EPMPVRIVVGRAPSSIATADEAGGCECSACCASANTTSSQAVTARPLPFERRLARSHPTRPGGGWNQRLPAGSRRAAPVLQVSRNGQIGERLRIVRADPQGLAEMADCFVEIAQFEERGPPVDVRVDAIRADAERRFEVPDGLWEFTHFGEGVAQVGLRQRVQGVDPEGLAIM